MTIARKNQVSLEATPYYHCVTRCVRSGFLCGQDVHTKRSYEHRRSWLEKRIYYVSQAFAIDVCAYAIMHNHYHLVVYINKEQAGQLSEQEVIDRWCSLHNKPLVIERYERNELGSEEAYIACKSIIEQWRKRLYDLSWFMKCINQSISRRANEEDGCTGHFWEGRFKSQALLDAKALIAAMVYTDLNPIRALVAVTLEQSFFTSIRKRILSARRRLLSPKGLLPFIGDSHSQEAGIPGSLDTYLYLVDWTGRQLHEYKKGRIDSSQPYLLDQLGFEVTEWLKTCSSLGSARGCLVGQLSSVQQALPKLERKKTFGLKFVA